LIIWSFLIFLGHPVYVSTTLTSSVQRESQRNGAVLWRTTYSEGKNLFIGHLIPQAYRHFIYLDCFNITLGDLNCGRSTTHPSKSENSYANDIGRPRISTGVYNSENIQWNACWISPNYRPYLNCIQGEPNNY